MSNETKKSGSWLLRGVLGGLVLLSVYWAMMALFSEHDVSGLNNKTPWGLLIVAYAFLVSSIGACFVGSLGSVFGIKKYEILEKKAIFLAIVVVVVGMAVIAAEMGHPFRMLGIYMRTPSFTSPIWWMGINYTLYLTFIIAEFWCLLKNNLKMAKIVGIIAFIAAVAAHSTVGSVFGVLHSKPFWYGPYLPIDFILCAWIMGFAMMIIVSYLSTDGKKAELTSLVGDMGKWLAVFLAANMFFIFWKVITGLHVGEGAKYMAVTALTNGPLSMRFWGLEIILGLVAPFLLLVIPSLRTPSNSFLAAVLAVIGMFVNKMNMVDAGQIVPTMPMEVLKSTAYISYSPSIAEISIVAGALSFILLFYSLADKYFLINTKEG